MGRLQPGQVRDVGALAGPRVRGGRDANVLSGCTPDLTSIKTEVRCYDRSSARASRIPIHPGDARATGHRRARRSVCFSCATTSRATSRPASSSSSASCRSRATSRCATRTPTSRSTICSRSPHSGLIKAIDRFEPGRGTKFTSYAAPTILGELSVTSATRAGRFTFRATFRSERSRSAARPKPCRRGSAARRTSARSPMHSAAQSRKCWRRRRRPRATRRRRWTRRRRRGRRRVRFAGRPAR